MLTLQSYVLNWYHKNLLHKGMYITEAIIRQRFYWPGIRGSVRKEVTNFDTCQRTKRSNTDIFYYQIRNLGRYHGISSV